MKKVQNLTKKKHWDEAWKSPIRLRLPCRLNVSVLNTTRLLRKVVKKNNTYFEIGCAPGKILLWVEKILQAKTTGLDYSKTGIEQNKNLVNALNCKTKLIQKNILKYKPNQKFDVVASFGIIEHFKDPKSILKKHIDSAKKSGTILITMPNYGNIYGKIQRFLDPSNLKKHNLKMMNISYLEKIIKKSIKFSSLQIYYSGSIDPWILNFEKKLPNSISLLIKIFLNIIGLLQFKTIKITAPLIVIKITK